MAEFFLVAALPLSSYADSSAEATQKVKATVVDSIAITTANSDGTVAGNVDLDEVANGGAMKKGAGARRKLTLLARCCGWGEIAL